MKYILLLAVIFAVALAAENQIENSLVLHSGLPRQSHSCPEGVEFDYTFDGQKCEVCMPNCKCTKYLGCTTCRSGYGKLYLQHQESKGNEASCYRCNTHGEKAGTANLIVDCCFQVSTTTLNPGQGKFRTHSIAGLRAIKCQDHITEQGVDGHTYSTKVFAAGSYCHYTSFCSQYTDYGRCSECLPGYWLNSDHTCRRCGYDSTPRINNCATCNGPNDCQTCDLGFYLPTFHYLRETEKPTENNLSNVNPSECRSCSANCTCTQDSKNLCSGCRTTVGYVFQDSASSPTCTRCTENVSGQICLNCSSDPQVCQKCIDGYLPIEGKCIKCPTHCDSKKCFVDTNGSKKVTACDPSGCENGYVYNAAKKDCNTNCPSPAARCELTGKNENNPLETEPTQCQQDVIANAGAYEQYEEIRRKLPIVAKNYFLITQDSKKICQDNSTLKCKKMSTNIAGNVNPFCDECYTEFGYHLHPTTKVCVECTEEHCINCDWTDTKLECKACVAPRQQEMEPRAQVDGGADLTVFNYVLVAGKCVACNAGCLSCSADKTCKTNCQYGYRAGEATCEKCDKMNCKECKGDKAVCEVCYPGFRLWKSTVASSDVEAQKPECESCEANCLKCENDRKVCTECAGGYYLLNGICRINRYKCVEHQADGSCKHCAYGYRNLQGFCYSCFQEGYVNCPIGCQASGSYNRDGDLITKSYYDQRMEYLGRPLSGSILKMAFAAIVCVIAIII